jgi:hypothetical protein
LQSLTVPASVERIGSKCCWQCWRLAALTFAPDSKLIHIGDLAFAHCSSLKALAIPPRVEFVGAQCFQRTDSLSTLSRLSPSRLRELLDFPPAASGTIEMPDSVEILSFPQHERCPQHCTLMFDHDSRLSRLTAVHLPSPVGFRCFAQVSTRSVKLFRSKLEFSVDCTPVSYVDSFPYKSGKRSSVGTSPIWVCGACFSV